MPIQCPRCIKGSVLPQGDEHGRGYLGCVNCGYELFDRGKAHALYEAGQIVWRPDEEPRKAKGRTRTPSSQGVMLR